MTVKVTLPSPAKLNLFLHINGRLENGYHELQSLFHFIDLADDMTFEVNQSQDVSLTCNIKELETDDNLIIKAVNALTPYLKAESPYNGVNIHLHKILPMGGGVGGGSSNAATTLLALNKLWQIDMPLGKLAEIGNTIGADVPIFIFGQSAIAEGTGDKFTPYPIDEKWYLVLTPDCHVNTAKLFGNKDLPRDTKKIPNKQVNYTGLNDNFKNDFQTLVYKEYPAVAKALDWLLEYAPSRLTGTGACVFAEFDSQAQAQEIHNLLPANLAGFVAKGNNTSATHVKLSELIGQ
jgi:4-diphosphocytidyl-2-C-methyl-D-erythritol kinase